MAIFLYELEDGEYKISTRSREIVDLSTIAVKYQGGGHKRAAGFSMTGDADEIVDMIVADVKEQL